MLLGELGHLSRAEAIDGTQRTHKKIGAKAYWQFVD